MGKENFPALYSVLEMIKNSENALVSVTVEGLSYNLDGDALRCQAETAMELLDAYKKPELPFQGITSEQIIREDARMHKCYGFVLWSNQMAGTDEDCASRVEDDPDYFMGMTEDEVRQISYAAYDEDREIMHDELDKAVDGPVLVFGKVGRWDGPKAVFKTLPHLSDVFSLFTGDQFTLYIEKEELKAENVHHDGTDRFTVHKFKEGFDPETFYLMDQVGVDTESLVPDLDRYFGWKRFGAKEESDVSKKQA